MFSATKFVVAGAIVALFGGFLLSGVLTQKPDGEAAPGVASSAASATPKPTATGTPTEEPTSSLESRSGADKGVLDTPLGPVRWLRIDRSGERQPPDGDVVIGAPDIALVRWQERPELWLSEDGATWTVEKLPRPSQDDTWFVTYANDAYWYAGMFGPEQDRRLRLWRSIDGAEWQQVSSEGVLPPGPVGMDWFSYVTSAAAVGDATVFSNPAFAQLPIGRLGIPGACPEHKVPTDRPGVYRLHGDPQECQGTSRLRFKETADGLRVFNDRTGKRLGLIEGANLGHIGEMAETQELHGSQLVLVEDGTLSYVEAPWGRSSAQLFSSGDRIHAIAGHGASAELWQSSDGRSWMALGPIDLAADIGVGADMSVFPDLVSITSQAYEGGQLVILGGWDSTDGVDWEPMPTGWPNGAVPVRLDSGWFAVEMVPRGSRGPVLGDSVWMHAGDEWISLAELGFDCSIDPDRVAKSVRIDGSGSTTLIWADRGCQDEGKTPPTSTTGGDLWVLEVGA